MHRVSAHRDNMLASKQVMPFSSAPLPATTDHDTAQRLRVVSSRLARRLRLTDQATTGGMTPARISALLNIERHGPLRLADLAESERLNPTMLSRIVGHLVEEGMCERYSDAGDRRSAWVKATQAGSALADVMRAQRTEVLESALGLLEEEDRASIERALPALEALAELITERRS